MLRLDRVRCFSLIFQFILSRRLSNGVSGSDVLLFSEFVNIVPILFYSFIEFITLLYTFLVTSFAGYKRKYDLSDFIYLTTFQMYYLFLHVQVLLVIFEAFA